MRTSHVAAPVVAALLAAALLAPSAATDLGKDMAAKLAKLNLTEAAAAAKVPGHIGLTTAKSWLDQKPGKTLKSLDMNQSGLCQMNPVACDGTCQQRWSGPASACNSGIPEVPNPADLPTVASGGVCGKWIGKCPSNECCSQFGFCVNTTSYYCATPSCTLVASPSSPQCAAAHAASHPVVRKYKMVATFGEAAPDGYTRPLIFINGKFPGPTIEGEVGDRVIIEFVNLLGEPATVHWHGIRQVTTNIQDGVAAVNQRPSPSVLGAVLNYTGIPPVFIYDFLLDAPGAYWYHSHYSAQYSDGLRGALIVRETPAPGFEIVPYPHEPVLFIHDWYHQLSNALLQTYINPNNPTGNEPVPENALANGVGQHYCGADCEYSVVAGAITPCGPNPAAGASTLLHVVSGATMGTMTVRVEGVPGLQTWVRSLDAVNTNLVNATGEHLQVAAGQRMGLLLCSDDPAASSTKTAWILSELQPDNFAYAPNYTTVWTVLNLGGLPDHTGKVAAASLPAPPDLPPLKIVLPPESDQPFGGAEPPPSTLDKSFWFESFDNAQNVSFFYVNGTSFQPPTSPGDPSLLERIYGNPSGATYTNAGTTPPPGGVGWNVVDLPLGSVLDITIRNYDNGQHPIHTHGRWVSIMNRGAENDTAPALAATMIRDTVLMPEGTSVVLRYVVDSPGVWIVHCHIDWHLVVGLGWVFRAGI